MYEDSPDGKGTAALLLAFMKKIGLERSVWKCLMMDGCAVNTAAVNRLVTLCNNVKVNRVRCLSLFLSLVGKNMDCELLRKVKKYLSYMKQSPKYRALLRQMFNEAIIRSGSICWYAEYEFIVQISKIGLNEVLEFAKACNDSKWAVKSSSKLLKMFKNGEDDTLGVEAKVKVIVTAGTIAWAGDLFCISCYILEGDYDLVFRADVVLSIVEYFTGANVDDIACE